MDSQWILAYECKTTWGETLYVFRHVKEEEPDRYYSVWVGDGFVEAEQITKERFIDRTTERVQL